MNKKDIPSRTNVRRGDALRPVLFCMLSGSRHAKIWTQFEPQGVEVVAHMDGIGMALLKLNAAA